MNKPSVSLTAFSDHSPECKQVIMVMLNTLQFEGRALLANVDQGSKKSPQFHHVCLSEALKTIQLRFFEAVSCCSVIVLSEGEVYLS